MNLQGKKKGCLSLDDVKIFMTIGWKRVSDPATLIKNLMEMVSVYFPQFYQSKIILEMMNN